jgi:hypothetical protein
MGFIDQFAVWQQVAGAIVIFGILSATLYWLLKRWNKVALAAPADVTPTESNPGNGSDAYAPMFRRIAPPSQPVPVPVTPETPRPGLSATTSTPSRTPTKPVSFTDPAPPDIVPLPPPQPVPLASPLTAAAIARPTAPPALASNPQRAVKIQPRTGAPIGDISAKPVTASIGTRLSVLSLSVVDKPYARTQLKPSEPTTTVAQGVGGPDPTTVRASTPVRVFSRDSSGQSAVAVAMPDSARTSVFREMPPGALSNLDKPANATGPVPTLNATTSRPSTSRIIPGQPGESDALSRFAAQMKSGGDAAPAAATPSIKPLVPEPRPMTATVPTVSPRMPNDPAAASTTGPNTVQLTIGFEIASLQLTPALKLGAVQIRPTSNIVSVQLDATSQATLQRLLAGAVGGGTPAFEIDKLELTAGGKIALITLAPKK